MRFPRIFWTIFFPAIVAWSFSEQLEYERTANRLGVVLKKRPGRLTMVYNSPLLMPVMVAVFAVEYFLLLGFSDGVGELLNWLLEAMLLLSIYYVMLLCCLPLLRRVFSARACATLWILPAFLYWLPHMWRNYPVKPRLVLKLSPELAKLLVLIWFVGFVAVLVWRITAHLLFRREVLADSYPVTDPAVLELWEREMRLIERKKPIPLLYSEKIVSPMTIGKNDKAIRTLLPWRNYSMAELQLIFRHELRHVQRLDVDTKMFYAFCEALCWFNPLVWIAMRKAAADLELSCDEMVLYGKEEQERRRYAELLLDSAGDDRGFTTCLSASAKTLRYRLKNVMKERKRLSGTLLVGFSLASLLLCCGMVVVSRTYGTVEDAIFQRAQMRELGYVAVAEEGYDPAYKRLEEVYGWDEEKITEMLGQLQVVKVMRTTDAIDFDNDRIACLNWKGLWLELSDEWLVVASSVTDVKGTYRVDSPVDWENLYAALDFDAPDPDPSPVRPRLTYYISHRENPDEPMGAVGRLLKRTDRTNQTWPTDEPLTNWDHAGGIHGYALPEGATVRFAFNYDPVWYTVEVIGQDGEESYTVKGEDLPDNVMKLAPYSANYRIRAYFESYRNTTYDMEFYFQIELPTEE